MSIVGAVTAVQFPPIARVPAHGRGEIEEQPPGYVGPDLSPGDLELEPLTLAPGTVALVAKPLPRDNGGVIFGDEAALVVDAGINGAIARHIQDLVRHLTDRPLRYVANTTYHGDHTFGNQAFPSDVRIVSSRANALEMMDLAREKRTRARNVHGDDTALDGVTHWRRPDILFEHFLELDLGGVSVQLWHFGPGNGPGDTMVYAPAARAVWSGNFLGHSGIAPMLLEGGPIPYVESLERMRAALDIDVVIPGHGPLERGSTGLDWMIAYLRQLDDDVRAGFRSGLTLEQVLDRRSPPPSANLDGIPQQAAAGLARLNRDNDRLNVLATYRALEGPGGGAEVPAV
jgi:cyclase